MKKMMFIGLVAGALIVSTVSGAFLTYKGFIEIWGTKYPLGQVELETGLISPIEGLEAREDHIGEIRVWTYSNDTELILQLVQLSQIVTNFRSFTVKVKLDLDVVFVVDLSGSMNPYMPTVREKLVELLGVLYMMNKDQVQVAVAGFKDYPHETIVMPWTDDYWEAKDFIEGLEAQTGAGIQQSHYLGFETALELFMEKPESWVHDRVVVFVSDAQAGYDDLPSFDEARDAVLNIAELGIKIHSVLCGPDEWPENKQLEWYADVTGGHFIGPQGQDRIVPGVTRDPTWIVKLTPITPFDSFRMPLRSSEPTMKEGFYTFHIYVDFFCKAVPWHEWFLTELTAHLEKAEIPPPFPPPSGPCVILPCAWAHLIINPLLVTIPESVTFSWEIDSPPEVTPLHLDLYLEDPDGVLIALQRYTDLPGDFTGSYVWTSTLPEGDWTVTMEYHYEYLGYPYMEAVSAMFMVSA